MGSLNNFAGRRREKMNRKGKKRKGKKSQQFWGSVRRQEGVCGLPWALTEILPNLD